MIGIIVYNQTAFKLKSMPTGEKNQAMKFINPLSISVRSTPRPLYIWFGLMIFMFLWGCAVKPTPKMDAADRSPSHQENTILSSRLDEPVTSGDLFKDLASCQIVYVGETHTNMAHHEIQLQVIQAVYAQDPNMVVGMEMFDYTYQDVLDLWSAGKLDETDFLRKVHWYANWRFDYALYREILNFIKEHKIPLVGLNIPGYIPKKIRVGGVENLRKQEKILLPQNIDTSYPAHREYIQNIFEDHRQHFSGDVRFEDFYAAQVVWEDIMAETIAKHLDNRKMVVLAGNGHIQFKYGIPDRAYKQTGAPFRTIYLASIGTEVERAIADYIWITK